MITKMKSTLNVIDIGVGRRLRNRRLSLRMDQKTFGEALGISVEQVRAYEKGRKKIDPRRLKEISAALGVPATFFQKLKHPRWAIKSTNPLRYLRHRMHSGCSKHITTFAIDVSSKR